MGTAVRSAFLSVLALAVVGAIGVALKQPWVFPSLGPTLMVMAETPSEPAARPLNAVVGHVVGLLVGLGSLVALGLRSHPSAVEEGLTARRVVCACVALGLTALVLQLVRLPHPPAGATTLLVSLGVLRTNDQLRTIVLSVLVVVAIGALFQVLLDRTRPAG